MYRVAIRLKRCKGRLWCISSVNARSRENAMRQARNFNERVINCVFMYSRNCFCSHCVAPLLTPPPPPSWWKRVKAATVARVLSCEFSYPCTPDDPKPPPLAYQNYNIYPFLQKLQIINTPKLSAFPLHTHNIYISYILVDIDIVT